MKKIRAIIVDDEPIIRNAIRKIGLWEQNGIEIAAESDNGLDALRIIRQEKIDLAFIDMNMPEMSGNDLMLRLSAEGLPVMVVVISGYDQFEYARAAINYGAIAYLLKPVDRKELNETLAKIRGIFNQRSSIVPDAEPQPAPPYDILQQIKKKVEAEYADQNLSISDIAAEFFISKEALSRSFKKRYSIGIMAYITRLRMEKARELLQLGYNNNQICTMIGYNDPNYFSRVFKAEFNISPSEYKREFQEKNAYAK